MAGRHDPLDVIVDALEHGDRALATRVAQLLLPARTTVRRAVRRSVPGVSEEAVRRIVERLVRSLGRPPGQA